MEKKILLVDDDSTFLFLHKKVLEKSGHDYSIREAHNGLEALNDMACAIQGLMEFPDVILLDLHMPVMDGRDFLVHFRQLGYPKDKKIRIVVLTTEDNPFSMKEQQELNIWRYHKKPMDMELAHALFEETALTSAMAD